MFRMNALGQSFVAAISSGNFPRGNRPVSVNPDTVAESYSNLQTDLAAVRDVDNGPQDQDPRTGKVTLFYQDGEFKNYRAHRLDASFEGTAESGSTTTIRTIPVGDKSYREIAWAGVDGGVATLAQFGEDGREGIIAPAAVVLDSKVPHNSTSRIWSPRETADSLGLLAT
jgi:hypothetical protein